MKKNNNKYKKINKVLNKKNKNKKKFNLNY